MPWYLVCALFVIPATLIRDITGLVVVGHLRFENVLAYVAVESEVIIDAGDALRIPLSAQEFVEFSMSPPGYASGCQS
jgi:hypothetical protein